MATVGIDAISFTRRGEAGREFRAPLGLAITIPDEDKFRNSYDRIMDSLFKKLGKPRKKRIYKAAHLTAQLQHLSHDFLHEFISAVCPVIQRLDFFYTFLKTERVPKVYIFGDSSPRGIQPQAFLDLIQNSYPHICLWRYLQSYSDCRAYTFQVDHFEGRKTPAWDDIQDLPNLKIYFSGDECNMAISTADLLLRWVQNTLQGPLGSREIIECFKDISDETHVKAFYLGYKREYLHKMAPNLNLDINTYDYIKHPLYIIAWRSRTGRADEKKSFEWDPLYNKVMDTACGTGGCVKFWDPAKDSHIIDESLDQVVIADEFSRPVGDAICRAYRKIKMVEASEI